MHAIVVTIFEAVQLILSFLQQCVCGKSFQNSVIVIAFLNHHHQCDSIFLSIIITMMVYSYVCNCGYYFWSSATHIVFFAAMCVWQRFSKQCDCDCHFESSSSSPWLYFLKHAIVGTIFEVVRLLLSFLQQCVCVCVCVCVWEIIF